MDKALKKKKIKKCTLEEKMSTFAYLPNCIFSIYSYCSFFYVPCYSMSPKEYNNFSGTMK